jgi:hypothetical protein
MRQKKIGTFLTLRLFFAVLVNSSLLTSIGKCFQEIMDVEHLWFSSRPSDGRHHPAAAEDGQVAVQVGLGQVCLGG